MIKTVKAIRYVTPLKEGGSLPAVVEADDGILYVMKFVGAGQGAKALIAELLAGEIGRRLGLPIPEIVFITLDTILARSEPNAEIQDLLKRSIGINIGLRYLPNAFAFNVLLQPPPNADLASAIVWFDAYITNVDRTHRNVNLLIWQDGLWLIDHGAALYFHHAWDNYLKRSETPFNLIKDHTLLVHAAKLAEANERLQPQLTATVISDIVALIPEQWLNTEAIFATITEHRIAYTAYLLKRLESAPIFVKEALDARAKLL